MVDTLIFGSRGRILIYLVYITLSLLSANSPRNKVKRSEAGLCIDVILGKQQIDL
jgi:hypothetical protein